MAEVVIMGELLCEIMRLRENSELWEPDLFKGPYPSGAPAIFADTAARLGCQTAIIGGVGNDDFGKCILNRLKTDGVDCSLVLESCERSTGVAFVTYYSDGSRKFIFHMGNTPAVEARMPMAEDLGAVKFFHIMGCSLMPDKTFAQEIVKTMHAAAKRGARISFDPNIRKELFTDQKIYDILDAVLENTNILLPGVEELLLLTGKSTVKEAVQAAFEREKLEILVLKNGSKGSVIYTRTAEIPIGVYPVEQVDATGAGDCFDGGFIAGLVKGRTIEEAARMGAAAGALNAAAFGPMEGNISVKTVENMIEAG